MHLPPNVRPFAVVSPALFALLWSACSAHSLPDHGDAAAEPPNLESEDAGAPGELDANEALDASGVDEADAEAQFDAAQACADLTQREDDVQLLINEIVVYPVEDFSHSQSGRDGFDGTSEQGLVSGADQYVELYNAGPSAIDVRGFRLDVRDKTPTTTTLCSTEGSVCTFSAGSSEQALLPGGFMLVGNPAGFASTDAYFVLRSPCGAVLDDVEVGGLTPRRDMEGDGVGDGAPSPDRNGRSHGRFDEAISRFPNGQDTGDDQADFVAMFPTPLRANVAPPVDPTDTNPPTILAGPADAQFPVTAPVRVYFDEPLDGPSGLSAVTLSVGGQALALGPADFENDDRTLVVAPVGKLPFDSDIILTVHGGSAGLSDRAGNRLAQDASMTFHTEPEPGVSTSLLINELVCDPREDFDSTGFDGTVSTGEVNSDDEWLELMVLEQGPLDARAYTLTIYNGPNTSGPVREVFSLAEAEKGVNSVVRVFGSGAGLQAVGQGDYIVIGNPVGSLSIDTYVELRDPAGRVVDHVEIGGNSLAADRGGDGINNGAPSPSDDGTSTEPADQSIARVPNGTDTNDDVADFCRAPPTLGAPNALACTR